MTVIIINRTMWNIQTVRNVTSITLANNAYTVAGDTTVTVSEATHYVRIME